MSQSESSEDSTTTVHPIQYIEMMSLAQEEDEEQEKTDAIVETEEATMVLKEEVRVMLQRLMNALDSTNEVLQFLLQIDRTMEKNDSDL